MKNVLIVDDVAGWRKFNAEIITELFGNDVDIDTAESATQAYDLLLQAKPYDIILTDLQMEDDYAPKFAGEWLIEQIRTFNRYNCTKVVIISASYNVRHVAENYNVECIPKSTALKCISAYKEVLDVK